MRRAGLALAVVAAATISAAIASAVQPAVYAAATSYVIAPSEDLANTNAALRLLQALARDPSPVATIAEAAGSRVQREQAVAAAGPGAEGGTVRGRARTDTLIVELHAEAGSAAAATSLAAAAGTVADAWTRVTYPGIRLVLLEPAVAPVSPARPDVPRDAVGGLIGGLALVAAGPWLVSSLWGLRARGLQAGGLDVQRLRARGLRAWLRRGP